MTEFLGLPHEGVLTRLGVSSIHGIGVFAIRAIRAGVNPFANDQRPIKWVDAGAIVRLAPTSPEQAFYLDFGIWRCGMIGCPETFDLPSAGWYVNEPQSGTEPNIIATPEFNLIASRDIAQGEELTVIYSTFSVIL